MNTETKETMTDRNTPWIAMTERRPTEGDFDGESFVRLYARVATTSSTTNHYSLGCFNETASYYPATDAYWFPVKIPPPPKPVASQREEDKRAACEWCSTHSIYGTSTFLAGAYAERRKWREWIRSVPRLNGYGWSFTRDEFNAIMARLDEQGEEGGE